MGMASLLFLFAGDAAAAETTGTGAGRIPAGISGSVKGTPGISQPPPPPSEPTPAGNSGGFLSGGTFEGNPSPGAGEGRLVQDPLNQDNRVLAFSADDYFVRTLAVPPGVDDINVSLRVLAPPSIQLKELEPGRMAPGVKIRVRHVGEQGNSGIREWVVNPMEGWQELSMVLKGIGDCRKELSLEAAWFDGAIFFDDLTVTSAFPAFLAEEIYQHFQTPAAVTYYYVVDSLFHSGRISNVGSPEITDRRVAIDFVLEGEKQVLWFVEKSREGDEAVVVVGPPNAGGDLFRLQRIDGKWAITGIEESDGI